MDHFHWHYSLIAIAAHLWALHSKLIHKYVFEIILFIAAHQQHFHLCLSHDHYCLLFTIEYFSDWSMLIVLVFTSAPRIVHQLKIGIFPIEDCKLRFVFAEIRSSGWIAIAHFVEKFQKLSNQKPIAASNFPFIYQIKPMRPSHFPYC